MDEVGVTELRQTLAEVCGLTNWIDTAGIVRVREDGYHIGKIWRPDLDIAQAVMAAEAAGEELEINFLESTGKSYPGWNWYVSVWTGPKFIDRSFAKALALAVYAWAKEKKHG